MFGLDLTVIAGAAGGLIALLLGIFLKGRASGKAAERDRQQKAQLDAYRDRDKIDDEIRRTDPDDLRQRLRDWSD
jgi:hypothetical protein